MKPGQRAPTEEEKRATSRPPPGHLIYSSSLLPQPGDMPYQPVGLFLPRSISDFLWERDEEEYPRIWHLYQSTKRDVGAL